MNNIDFFETMFYEEIDSWFSADIACCDNCYEDFLKTWPFAYLANNAEFQKSGRGLETFYDGSRLRDLYSADEFNYFIKNIKCPRCDSPLSDNIWPYELPFEKDRNIESTIDDLAAIANKTPFLLLKHPFSEKVFSTIRSIANSTKPVKLKESLFKARPLDIPNPNLIDFDFPPKECVKEGRYNHAGIPVLYLASDKKTCFYEMRKISCTVAEIVIKKKLKILDFINIDDHYTPDEDILKTLVYSALISSEQEDEGWHKPKYMFSRFVADCALDAGFHAIKYPSTRLFMNNYNLVIIDPSVTLEKYCSIEQFCKIGSTKDL